MIQASEWLQIDLQLNVAIYFPFSYPVSVSFTPPLPFSFISQSYDLQISNILSDHPQA